MRIGVSEIVRWGAAVEDMDDLGALIGAALADDPADVAAAASDWRRRFTRIRHVR